MSRGSLALAVSAGLLPISMQRPEFKEKKMSKIHRMAAGAAMAVAAVAFLVIAEPASAAPRRAAVNSAPQRPAVNYCLSYHGNDCSFTTMAQCQATASGLGAECFRMTLARMVKLFSGSYQSGAALSASNSTPRHGHIALLQGQPVVPDKAL